MSKLVKPKVITILCLIALIVAMPGCSGTKVTVTRELPQKLDKLSLTEMWNVVADTADIQERSAELGEMHLRTGADGGVDSLYFTFQGRNEKGIPCIYFAEMGREGKIDIREYEDEPVLLSAHPMTVFAEIDKLGLASMEPGEAGLSLQLGFQYGDIGYSYDHLDLYHLEDGELIPLKEIVFHSRDPWCTVSVFELYPVAVEEGSMASSVKTAPGPVRPGERTSQIWFLSEDVNKAEIVEYLGNGWKSDYDDFVSGIQDVLPEGWEMESISQEGLMGHPHGLNEPLFRIDFVDRTHQFEGPGGRTYFPSLRLYFYDIQEKGTVLETIEQEKVYSWDVPDYFDKTAEYIVVTSPLYINGGCFSDEAMSLYEPLEKALKDYFNAQ